MLALAEELQNISLACRKAGISRSHYYEIKEAFERYGSEGLAPRARRRPRMPNQTPPELEARILEMTRGTRRTATFGSASSCVSAGWGWCRRRGGVFWNGTGWRFASRGFFGSSRRPQLVAEC